jgi:enamine deaminase RidA (YjgF/YER057c/UK114 family)
MLKASNPKTIAAPVAMYSHSVEVPPNARWLYTAGQVGIRPDGTLPEGFEAQHDQIWRNTLAILADAGMGPENIVRLNVYSTDPRRPEVPQGASGKISQGPPYPCVNMGRCQPSRQSCLGGRDGDDRGEGLIGLEGMTACVDLDPRAENVSAT